MRWSAFLFFSSERRHPTGSGAEGIAFNQIDIGAAAEHGIYVCNQKGANAVAVAEQTIMLMLALLRNLVSGYRNVRAGHQIETKMYLMSQEIPELNEMKVGLVGFGDIGKESQGFSSPSGRKFITNSGTGFLRKKSRSITYRSCLWMICSAPAIS